MLFEPCNDGIIKNVSVIFEPNFDNSEVRSFLNGLKNFIPGNLSFEGFKMSDKYTAYPNSL